jgi:hypothetical protein
LPPVTFVAIEATNKLNDTLALVPQLVPIKHDEKATPAAAAHEMGVPVGPVRLSVFKSFVGMWEKKNEKLSSVPRSKAAKLLTLTLQR